MIFVVPSSYFVLTKILLVVLRAGTGKLRHYPESLAAPATSLKRRVDSALAFIRNNLLPTSSTAAMIG